MMFSGIMGIFGILYAAAALGVFVLTILFLVKGIKALDIYIKKNEQ
jgi:hypothetical protein